MLAAFDGALRTQAGQLISAPDPRHGTDPIAAYLGRLAAADGRAAADTLGFLLAAVLRAALVRAGPAPALQGEARAALAQLVR